MEPFQYDLRGPAAKDNSITHAAGAPSNLDAAITIRSAKTGLQNTRRRMARERRGAESSVVSMETLYYKTIY